jgi:hypothetical protein
MHAMCLSGYPNISVGEILLRMADAAARQFPIGESLMQAILSPQEAADLLFYLMNAMSTASASTTTPSTRTTSSDTGASITAGALYFWLFSKSYTISVDLGG